MTFDTLSAARNLQAARIDPKHADAIVPAMRSAVTENLATKTDLRDLEQHLKNTLGRVVVRRSRPAVRRA